LRTSNVTFVVIAADFLVSASRAEVVTLVGCLVICDNEQLSLRK